MLSDFNGGNRIVFSAELNNGMEITNRTNNLI